MDDDEEWTVPKRAKRRKSLFNPKNRDNTCRRMDQEDWCIPKKITRRESCSNERRDSEDNEPITIDKVLGFLNGDDDLIKFSSSESDCKPKTTPENLDTNTENENANLTELKPVVDKFEIEEHSLEDAEKRYEMNVFVEVEQEDSEFDDDTASEPILIPEIPHSDEDEDLSNVFGDNKPIITSVKSLRGNSDSSESEDIDFIRFENHENSNNKTLVKQRSRSKFKKIFTHDHTVVTERYGELLTPVRYEPIYERKEKRRQKPINRYKDDDDIYYAVKNSRRIKCKHCGIYFYRNDLDQHMIEVESANTKIIDKLLQIPVVKVVDVAKDDNLDPKLKARVKDLKFKRENRSVNYTLRHCVHCDKSFVTQRQFNNHIVDVIFGLDILKKGNKLSAYSVKLQRNNVKNNNDVR